MPFYLPEVNFIGNITYLHTYFQTNYSCLTISWHSEKIFDDDDDVFDQELHRWI